MSLLFWRGVDEIKDAPVNEFHPLPTNVFAPVRIEGRLLYFPPIEIPGIATADALDANDQMGAALQLLVPKRGSITKALLLDRKSVV